MKGSTGHLVDHCSFLNYSYVRLRGNLGRRCQNPDGKAGMSRICRRDMGRKKSNAGATAAVRSMMNPCRTRLLEGGGAVAPDRTRSTAPSALMKPGDEAPRAGHVSAVVLAEGIDHQLLLPADAEKVERSEADQTGKPGDPVRQEQRLRHGPEPEGGVHRVAHVPVHPMGDELVAFAHLETDGPVAAERPV